MILEVAQLAVCLVLDLIGVLAPIQGPILLSNVDTNPSGKVLLVERLPLPVARHPVDAKRNGDPGKERATVEGWEIAVDTSSDLLPQGMDRDRLRHSHGAILANHNAALVVENPLSLCPEAGA